MSAINASGESPLALEKSVSASNRSLPEIGFLRLSQIIGNPDASPPVPAIIPIKKTCWWDGVRTGRFPQPVRLSSRCTAWCVEDIRALVHRVSTGVAP